MKPIEFDDFVISTLEGVKMLRGLDRTDLLRSHISRVYAVESTSLSSALCTMRNALHISYRSEVGHFETVYNQLSIL